MSGDLIQLGGGGHPGNEKHHYYRQASAPTSSDPLQVGDLWVDTTNNLLKRCTSTSPITFVSVEGGSASHDLGGSSHDADTLANLNSKISDATLDDSGDSRDPNAHDLAGSEHNADTLANLNSKVSDATLDDSGDPRDPNAHDLGGSKHNADTLANLNGKVSDGTLVDKDSANTWSAKQTLQAALALTSGQIEFPASQSASGDANTLDDYEEGTWTPVLTFDTEGDLTVVYSKQEGLYTKVGDIVVVAFIVTISTFTHSTASGAARITGLPFNTRSGVDAETIGNLYWGGITKANYTQVAPRAAPNDNKFNLYAFGSGQSPNTVKAGDMPSGGSVTLRGAIVYFV